MKYDFKSYMLISSGIVVIYYVLKVIIIYTKDKKEYLKGLSDISKIVKEDEPIKKEAKKRNKNEKEKEETYVYIQNIILLIFQIKWYNICIIKLLYLLRQ